LRIAGSCVWSLTSPLPSSSLPRPRPGLLDFTGRRKHGAWEKQKGKDKIAAMEAYIAEVERQISTYGTKA